MPSATHEADQDTNSETSSDTSHDLCHPEREWFVRCSNEADRPAVCSITVNDGHVELWVDDRVFLTLENSEIVLFATAFTNASALASEDRAHPQVQG